MDAHSSNPAPPRQRRPDEVSPLAAHDEVAAGVIAHLFERQLKQHSNSLELLRGVPHHQTAYGPEREAYVGWIYQLSDKLKFGYDTGTSAVILADRTLVVLSRVDRNLPQEGLELVCVACLLISAKMEEKEVDIPPVSYVLKKAGVQRKESETDVRRELQAMELIVLQASDWNACVVSPTHFVAFFVDTVVSQASSVYGSRVTRKAAKAGLALAVQITRLALDDAPLVTWLPSWLALAAVMLGFEIIQMPMWGHLDAIAEELGTEIEPGESAFWLCARRLRLLVDPLSKGALGSHPPSSEMPAKVSTQKSGFAQKAVQGLESVDHPRTPASKSALSSEGGKRSLLPLSPASPASPSELPSDYGKGDAATADAAGCHLKKPSVHTRGGVRVELRPSGLPRKIKAGSKPRIGSL